MVREDVLPAVVVGARQGLRAPVVPDQHGVVFTWEREARRENESIEETAVSPGKEQGLVELLE